MPTYRILITPEAERQLSHEMRYSRRRWGKAHQQAFRRGLRVYIGQVAENPHVHREHSESFGVCVAQWKGLQVVYLLNEEEQRMIIVAFVGRNRLIENALPDTIRTRDD